MNSDKWIVRVALYGTLIAVIAIIAIPTVYKVVKDNRKKLADVNEKTIVEKAEKCIYEGNCKTNIVTLKTLYEKAYIKDKVVNPYDKTLYSEDSYVVVKKEGSTLYLK